MRREAILQYKRELHGLCIAMLNWGSVPHMSLSSVALPLTMADGAEHLKNSVQEPSKCRIYCICVICVDRPSLSMVLVTSSG